MEDNFKIGDVVRVKGQETTLTIISKKTASNEVWCIWFDKNGALYQSTFKTAILESAVLCIKGKDGTMVQVDGL